MGAFRCTEFVPSLRFHVEFCKLCWIHENEIRITGKTPISGTSPCRNVTDVKNSSPSFSLDRFRTGIYTLQEKDSLLARPQIVSNGCENFFQFSQNFLSTEH